MAKYTVRAYHADGSFAFGATLNCADTESALARFSELPLKGVRAELLKGAQQVAVRGSERGAKRA